jgi:hypothetical protein
MFLPVDACFQFVERILQDEKRKNGTCCSYVIFMGPMTMACGRALKVPQYCEVLCRIAMIMLYEIRSYDMMAIQHDLFVDPYIQANQLSSYDVDDCRTSDFETVECKQVERSEKAPPIYYVDRSHPFLPTYSGVDVFAWQLEHHGAFIYLDTE